MSSIKSNTHSNKTVTDGAKKEIADMHECPICYEPIESVDFCITKCGHRFHTSCLIQSSKFKSNCPYCRASITSEQQQINSDIAQMADDGWRVGDIPGNIQEELNRISESRRRQQAVLNQALIEVASIAASNLINDEDEDEELRFVPVVSRLISIGRNSNCGICGQQGHNRRTCVFRGSFM